MLVLHLTIQDLTYHTEDIDGCHDNGCTSNDGSDTMELVGILERTHEDGHLSNETREARQTEVGKTCHYITHSKEWHDLHQTVQVTDVTGMGTSIDHTDEGEEECRHQTVREHLQDCTRTGCLGHHQQGEEHQTAVGHRTVGIDILQVGLDTCGEGSVHYRDRSENQEYPRQLISGIGQQIHGNTETAVASELHQHTGMQHRHSRRCGSMTVR